MAVDCEHNSKYHHLGKSCLQSSYAKQTVLPQKSVVALYQYRPKTALILQEKYSALASRTPTAFTNHILRGTSFHRNQNVPTLNKQMAQYNYSILIHGKTLVHITLHEKTVSSYRQANYSKKNQAYYTMCDERKLLQSQRCLS
jgi:hypothetical protein